jgi:hypothetical protein
VQQIQHRNAAAAQPNKQKTREKTQTGTSSLNGVSGVNATFFAGIEISADMEYQQIGYRGFGHVNRESITNKNAGLFV